MAVATLAGFGWSAVVLLLGWVTVDAVEPVSGPDPARPEDAVALLAGVAGLLLAGWLALATLLTLLAAAHPCSWAGAAAAAIAQRITPAGLRRAVVLTVGVGLVGAVPAFAADAGTGGRTGTPALAAGLDPAWAVQTPAGDLDPGWIPTPLPSALVATSPPETGTPVVPAAQVDLAGAWPAARPQPRPRVQDREEVVVGPGDCLWDVAARWLGSDATTEQIAAAWPRWYHANRAVIGDQPDLLEPGQRLRPPGDPATPGGAGRGGQP